MGRHANDVDVNKISDKQKRQAEKIEDKLEKQGMGRDQAEQEAQYTVADQPSGGSSTHGGDVGKGANHERGNRRGSDKQSQTG